MTIEVTTQNQTVEVSTSGQTVNATVSGGQGPQGPAGSAANHASTHASGGTDPVSLAASQITSGVIAPARLGTGFNGPDQYLISSGEWAQAINGLHINDCGTDYISTDDSLQQVMLSIDTAIGNRALTTHTHGSITTDGKIGSTSNLLVGTGAGGTLGTVTLGTGLTLSGGVLSGTATYSLPVATSSILGGVKAGANVTISGTGVISVAAPVTSLAYSALTGVPSTFTPSAHVHAASEITSGVIDTARLATGTASSSTYLRGDGTWATVTAGVSSVAGRTGAVTLAAADVSGLAASATTDTTSASNITSGTLPAARIPATAVTAGSYGSPNQALSITVGADGRLTSASSGSITIGASAVAFGVFDIGRIPTGTTSTTVCLGNDSRLSDARTPTSHTHAASDIASGTIATARLGSGTADSTTYLRGDQTWATISSYTLPAATVSSLGGVIVGSGLSVTSGTVSANVTSVAGRTGAVTIAASDVSGLGSLATASSVAYSSLTGTPSTFTPSTHASSHASGGSDAISIAASQITSGTIATARLGSGTADSTTFLRGDQTYATVSPTYASTTQAQDGVSTSVAMSPARTLDEMMSMWTMDLATFSASSSNSSNLSYAGAMAFYCSSGSAAGSNMLFPVNPTIWSPSITKSSNPNGRYINWTRRQRFRIRLYYAVLPTTNCVYRFLLGKTSSQTGTANIGALSVRGIGFEVRASGALWLTAHNGTSRTDTSAGTSLAANAAYEVMVDSDGAGNATLFLDGTSIATNTGAPTTLPSDSIGNLFVCEATSTDTTQIVCVIERYPQVLRS